MKALATVWTKHLSEDKKGDFEALVRNSTTVLTRVQKILDEKEQELNNIETNINEYDNPAWSHKQAYLNGRKAALKDIKQLFNFLGV